MEKDLEALFLKAGADRWGLSKPDLQEAVSASVRHAFPDREPTGRELAKYLASLHIEDLALAAACARGSEAAWDHFVLQHRPVLYRAADALDPSGGARELADSLYADLYGMETGSADRRSLFRYFHGRSSLGTWLRAVLARRYVDLYRSRRRTEPLPEEESAAPAAHSPPADPDRERLTPLILKALLTAIDRLVPKDRLRLRSYYGAHMTLARIARITGEHEATVSRQLARTRREIRSEIERELRESARLSDAEIARAFEFALDDPGELNLHEAFGVRLDRKNTPEERSK